MATVRIYKVAELLNTSSQEVMALLKRDHGIEVRSASSTIEEVVAREFVSRMARQRGILTIVDGSSRRRPSGVAFGVLVHAVLARAPFGSTRTELNELASIEARVLGLTEEHPNYAHRRTSP